MEPTNPDALEEGGGGGFPHTIGNPDLFPETADTWTAGIVFDSNLDNPWLADVRIAIDYYKIEIKDAIGEQSVDLALQQCIDPLFNPTYDPNSAFCGLVPRDPFGNLARVTTSFFNNGWFSTSGIDFQINWSMDAGPGRASVNSTINYLMDRKSTEVFGLNPVVDYTGTSGTDENGQDGWSYEWRARTEVSYTYEDLRVGISWQAADGVDPEAATTVGTDFSGVNVYHIFDLNGNYNVTDNLFLRFGAENVLNISPPIWMINTDPEPGTNVGGGFPFGGSIYDTRGRRYYLGATVNFE